MKVLLDTNFLMIPGKFRVDIFSELQRFGRPELHTLDLVVKELEEISSGQGRDSSHARLALELLKANKVKVLKSQEVTADKEILRISPGFTVCTLDKKLIEKLRKRKTPVIFLRQGRFLEM